MADLFLYGALADPALIELASGRNLASMAPEPARLGGHVLCRGEGRDFPRLAEAPGAHVDGMVLRAAPEPALARLRYVAECFGHAQRVLPLISGEPVVLFALAGAGVDAGADAGGTEAGPGCPEGLFAAEEWRATRWPLLRHAIAEVTSLQGMAESAAVAARLAMVRTRAAAALLAETDAAPCTLRADWGRDAVELSGQQTGYFGFFLLRKLGLRHRRFDGTMSEPLDREVFVAGDAMLLLPYDPVRDRVMLVEQFRMGPFGRGDGHPWLLEPIAGRVDGGESPEETAIREAREEAGLEIARLEPIGHFYSTPGYSTEMFHAYVGIADLPDDAAGAGGLDQEHEDIRSHVVPFETAMRLVEAGEANAGPLILLILWLARERERLRGQAGAGDRGDR